MRESRKQLTLLISLWSVWFFVFLLRMSIKSIIPVLKTEFQSTHFAIGFSVAALVIGYSLMQIPAGYLADKTKKRLVITPGIILAISMMFLASYSENLISLIIYLFFTGVGLGTYYPAGMGLITEWFSKEKRGKAIGAHETAASAGSIIGPAVAGFFVSAFNWRLGFRCLALSGIIIMPLIYFFGQEKNGVNKNPSTITRGQFKELVPLIIIFTLTASGWMGYTTYLTSYLTNIGYSEAVSGGLFSIMPAISLLSMPLAGHVSDTLGRRKLVVFLLLFSSPFIYLTSRIQSFSLIAISLGIIGLTMFASYPVVITFISDKISAEVAGSAFGVVNAIGMGVSALASPAIGFLIDLFNYQTAFLAVSLLVILSAIIIWFEKEEKNNKVC